MIPKVKICCINSIEEAKTAIVYGASAIGLVGKMPSGPGVIPDKLIHDIAKQVPHTIDTFLLTSETSTEGIIRHHHKTQTNTIQIVDRLIEGSYDQLRQALPGVKLVQVVHVLDENSVSDAIDISPLVDGLLLDSGNPNLQIKELGGTGRVHNWKLSKKIRDRVNVQVFLAGGLNPENVRQAYKEVEPYGIDVCSGVRTSGYLDLLKLEKFFDSLKLYNTTD